MNERKDQIEKVKELTNQLHDGIKTLFESDRYKDYLKTMAKFHNYSFNNSLLIWLQRPDASAVAGYRAWQTNFQRFVKPGSKGIMIIEPVPWKFTVKEKVLDEDGLPMKDDEGKELTQDVEKTYQRFKVGYVYAYEDTLGKELPSIVSILDAGVDNYDSVIEALRTVSPAPIRFDSISYSANGYYDLIKREIVVKDTLPQAQRIKTAVHEVAHSILHDRTDGLDLNADKREMEVSAESVAFVVCTYLGLQVSDYSFGYVAGWSEGKELKELQAKMELIRSTANTIITGIQETLAQKEMLTNALVIIVKQDEPIRSMSHRQRC